MIVLGRLSQYERPITVSQTVVRSDDRFRQERPQAAIHAANAVGYAVGWIYLRNN